LIGGKIDVLGLVQTFHSTAAVPIEVIDRVENFHFVLNLGQQVFNFRLTKEDKRAISGCAKQLWDLKKGSDGGGRCVSLKLAAPILLRYDKRQAPRT
jgi:hypothetical protein